MRKLTRSQAITLLRTRCLALTDDETSMCQVAAEHKIMCGGFSQWTFSELRERYDWIVKSRPGITREQLEELANRWQLARQYVNEERTACDNQEHESLHQICTGWEGHDNAELSRYCEELLGESIEILPDPESAEPEPAPG